MAYVFGYGSLVDPRSASRTLGRPVSELRPARLRGWRRRWSQIRENERCEKTFAHARDGSIPRHVLGLSLIRAEGDVVNGALLEVTEDDLGRLDVREHRYERVSVAEQIESDDHGGAEVVAYVARAEHHEPDPPPSAVILRSYLDAVEAAFAGMGQDHLDEFRATTGPPPVEVIEAVLVRDEIPQGNPRDW